MKFRDDRTQPPRREILVELHASLGRRYRPEDVADLVLLPREVLDGSAGCARADVEAACRTAGLDPERSGWTVPVPAPGRGVAVFRPTPELVHGVGIADPVWAALLRRGRSAAGTSSPR
ncbi:hypothetical protein [Streptosporangium sp. V21-05]|uniref:hypothetical protein n=1 Tax=Streptosporangium sp. V21-05 TaxID=3446115 RepID=UPI003F53DB4D